MTVFKKNTASIVIFVILFLLYSLTAATHPVGYADSTEIILTGYFFSVAHPPGYQLMVAVVGVAIRLFPFLTPAHAANIANAFVQAGALTIMFNAVLLLFKITLDLKELNKKHLIAAGFSTLLLGFSALFWLYGAMVEVRSVNNVLAAFAFFSGLKYWSAQRHNKRGIPWLVATSIAVGLGILHHPTFVLIVPSHFFILLITHSKRQEAGGIKESLLQAFLALASIAVGIGFSLALLLTFNQNDDVFSWSFPATAQNIINHVGRQDYSGHFVTEGKTYAQNMEKEVLVSAFGKFKPLNILKNAIPFYRFQIEQLGVPFLILALIGVFYIYKKNKNMALVVVSLALFTGPVLGSYLILPDLSENQDLLANMRTGIIHRQYLLGQLSLVPLVSLGALYAIENIKKAKKPWLPQIFALISISLLFLQVLDNHTIGNQRNNTLIQDNAVATLNEAEEDAVIICGSDIACYSLIYENQINQVRPDVTILTKNNLYRAAFLRNNKQFYPLSYKDNPAFHAQQIAWNVANRPTYLTDPTVFYVDYVGLEGDPFLVSPSQSMFKISLEDNEPDVKNLEISDDLLTKNKTVSEKDYFFKGVIDYFAGIFEYRGTTFANYGLVDEAREEFEYSLSLSPTYQQPMAWIYQLERELPFEKKFLREETPTSDEYLSKAKELFRDDKEAALSFTRKAVYIDPFNAEARLFLAAQYTHTNKPEWSIVELEHVKRLIPEYEIPREPLDVETYLN